jgi:two-component system, chemotaxis family, response regulator Rcp1
LKSPTKESHTTPGRNIPKQEFTILLVEDNPGDVRLAREALRDTPSKADLRVARDGEEAIAMLKNPGENSRPDLILLDFNLPRKDGREVLADIKKDPDLRAIPVIVLSTSRADSDIRTAYDLRANCFITKGEDWDRSRQIIQCIEEFWLRTASLPEQRPAI